MQKRALHFHLINTDAMQTYNDTISPFAVILIVAEINRGTYCVSRYDFQGMIDYIFFTKKQITVAGILGPLDPEWLAENKVIGCPHQEIPSDHIPLVAQLQLFK